MVRIVDLDGGDQTFVGRGWLRPHCSADGKSVYANSVLPGVNINGMVGLSADGRPEPEPILVKLVGQSPCPSQDGKSLVFCTIPQQAEPDGTDRSFQRVSDGATGEIRR